ERELVVASGARIADVALDQRTQAEALVQLAREKQTSVGGDRFGVTHWMMPSATREAPQKPHFWRALSDYGPVGSLLKTKMRANLRRVVCGALALVCRIGKDS